MQARKASEWSCISGITEDSFNLSRTNQQMHQLFGMRGRAFSLSHSLKAESDTFELSAATLPFSPFHSAEERRLSTTRKSSDLFDLSSTNVALPQIRQERDESHDALNASGSTFVLSPATLKGSRNDIPFRSKPVSQCLCAEQKRRRYRSSAERT
ncbi:hypothetical protein DIPPA_32441 [Diplonema papillatum]|nr:hypothetical protein DIPPA_32441 [Diplonema papillatum]